MWQAIEHDAEELIKWDRAMKRCQQTLADSARFAAWHSVSPCSLRTTMTRMAPSHFFCRCILAIGRHNSVMRQYFFLAQRLWLLSVLKMSIVLCRHACWARRMCRASWSCAPTSRGFSPSSPATIPSSHTSLRCTSRQHHFCTYCLSLCPSLHIACSLTALGYPLDLPYICHRHVYLHHLCL